MIRQVARVVPSFLAAAWLASQCDYVVMLPARLAELVGPTLKLRTIALRVPQEPIVIAQIWHPRFDADVAHGLLRDAVRRAAADRPSTGRRARPLASERRTGRAA